MTGNDLAPGLLLAAPSLRDPNFARTVVLLGRHDGEGALGWVINGQEIAPVGELLRASELWPSNLVLPVSSAFQRMARVGGPVAPATGWLVYRRATEALPGEMALGELAVTGEASAFNALTQGGGPSEFRLLLGCAGWAPGQLEAEIGAGVWLPAALEGDDILLDTASAEIWEGAFQRAIGSAPAAFMTTSGPAKA